MVPADALIKAADPLPSAKFVAFQTLLAPDQMPSQKRTGVLDWPYVEGLRMDEAMHPLAIMAVGLYGEALPNVMARRCGWWCRGNMASRASNRL